MRYHKKVTFLLSFFLLVNYFSNYAQSNLKIGSTENSLIQLVKDIKPGYKNSYPHKITHVGDDVYFVADHLGYPTHYGIWKTTGFEAGTQLVVDLDNPEISGNYGELTNFNGELVFRAASTENYVGHELWITDNSLDGISLVKDIFVGDDSGWPNQITVYGNILLFFASSFNSEGERTGQELWRSDGTNAGTYMVKEIMPGTKPGVGIDGYNSSAILDGIYYFAAKGPGEQIGDDWIGGLELWRSDGTEAGTYIVKDLTPTYQIAYGEADWSRPHNITYFKNKIIFSAYGAGIGNELYQSDGTKEGTIVLKDIFPNDGSGTPCGASSISSYPGDFVVTPNYIYFLACDGFHGRELWVTNGTEAGTKMISDFTPGLEGTIITEATALNDMLFFVYDDGDENHGNELWYTDGLKTELVMDIATGVDVFEQANNSDPADLTQVYDGMYFSAWTPEHGRELWYTNGEPGYTHLVEEMYADNWGGDPNNLAFIDSTLYFSARSENFVPGLPQTGYELWKLQYLPTGVDSESKNVAFKLNQNYPNPFNPATKIEYSIPKQSYVSLKIYNLLGEEVATLVTGSHQPGKYSVTFKGSSLSSGVYFYRLQSGSFVQTKKLILLK